MTHDELEQFNDMQKRLKALEGRADIRTALGNDGNVIVRHDVLLVRKRPVEVTAKIWDNTENCYYEMCNWMGDNSALWYGVNLVIKTLEGDMTADVGDYIIRGVNGEFYPCKPDIFHKTYDIVEVTK